jgi:hypothetical protein
MGASGNGAALRYLECGPKSRTKRGENMFDRIKRVAALLGWLAALLVAASAAWRH